MFVADIHKNQFTNSSHKAVIPSYHSYRLFVLRVRKPFTSRIAGTPQPSEGTSQKNEHTENTSTYTI